MTLYEFSAPMPYDIENINKLSDINKNVEKSKITSLYFSLPANCELFTGFEQYRNESIDYNFEYWKRLISNSIEKNFDFIYLFNRPNSNEINEEGLKLQLEKLDKLLSELKKLGVNKLRVSDHKLLMYLHKEYPNFILYSSTCFEYKMIGEYQNFINYHPYVKQIVPSHDVNKNFKLLKTLVKNFPNTEIELMVNQGCQKNCPFRNSHQSYIEDYINPNSIFSNSYYLKNCYKSSINNPFIKLTKNNLIFPWEIEEYGKIGIKNFKFTGRDNFLFFENKLISSYIQYLKGIDNYKNIENLSINLFSERLQNIQSLEVLKVKDVKKYMPNIKHFIKKGHLCASICNNDCQYCYKCADKIQKIVTKNEKHEKNKNIQICIK